MTTRTPYQDYKPSGIDWLGIIPSHWGTVQLNRMANETKLRNRDMQETTVLSLSYGRIIIKDPDKKGLMPENFNTYQVVNPGNIILRLTDLQNDQTSLRVGLAKNRGIITSAYICLNPTSQVDSRYLHQLLHSFDEGKHLYGMGSGVRQGLSYKELRRELFPLPPFDEQRAIADYLDRKDAQITRFIESRRRMIALLEEKKQAIINQAVTRGLDPTVPMKDSGVEWLGEIPAHWDVATVGRFWSVIDCKHVTVPFVPTDEKTFPLASVRQTAAFDLSLTDARHTTAEWYEFLREGGREPHAGDLIFCRNVNVGHCSLVGDYTKFAMGQDVCLLKGHKMSPRFFNFCVSIGPTRSHIERLLVGSTFNRINVAQIRNLVLLVPPVQEQVEIAAIADEVSIQIREQVSKYEKEIELINEYRTRLISDVVTGKVKVF